MGEKGREKGRGEGEREELWDHFGCHIVHRVGTSGYHVRFSSPVVVDGALNSELLN